MSKILFNDLSITTNYIFPSVSYAVLKEYLLENNIHSDIIYSTNWLKPVIETLPFKDQEFESYSLIFLVVYLHYLALENEDEKCVKRLELLLAEEYSNGSNINLQSFIKELNYLVNTCILNHIENDYTDVSLACFSFKHLQWLPTIWVCKELKLKKPQIKTVMGGFGYKEEAIQHLINNPYLDFCIWGEGEFPLHYLYQSLHEPDKYNTIPRLVYRKNNQINVSDIISSDYININNLFPLDFGLPFNEQNIEMPIPIETVRGCYWGRCIFCYRKEILQVRQKNPEIIVKHIKLLTEKFNKYKFTFVDDDIVGQSIEHFEKLLDLIIAEANKANIHYDFFADIIVHGFSERIIKKMHIAGFSGVLFGVESFSDSLLKKMNKRTNVCDIILFVKFAFKYGIQIKGFNIIKGLL